jgi:hypothetical protein
MAYVLTRFRIDDYETWKRELFDADPVGRRQVARGHRILRSADNPAEVFVQTEFDSLEEARAFREKLMSSAALEHVEVLTPPTVAEEVDAERY